MSQQLNTLLRDKAWARWTALILLAAAMFFAYIFVDILSPLQASLQSLKGWDPSAYGHYTGSEMFLNVFVFFLIFAGVILDKMGVRFTAILSGCVMLVGAFVNYYALTDSLQVVLWKFGLRIISISLSHGGMLHPGMRVCLRLPNFRPLALCCLAVVPKWLV